MSITIQIVVSMALLVTGAGLMTLNRKYLLPRNVPVAIAVSIAIATLTISVAIAAMGISMSASLAALILGSFVGVLWVRRDPGSPVSALLGLAAAAGLVALYSAAMSELTATALALAASGVLLRLTADVSRIGQA